MSELGKMDIPEEIIEVIQSSIPDGQAIRHVGLMFNQSSDRLDRIIPATEYFLAATDSFLVYITTRWDWANMSNLYGPIRPKWSPEIIFQRNLFISDIKITIPYNLEQATKSLAKPFKNRGHQLDGVGSFYFYSDGFGSFVNSFFDDVKKIYDHIQDTQLRKKLALDNVGQASSNNKSQITKCLNCGSTELIVRGEYVVCDYCQSKFSR